MTNIATTTFNDWDEVLTGTGAITASGDKFSISSIAGVDKAYFRKYIPAIPGEKVTLTCLARVVSGSSGTYGRLGIDYPNSGQLKNSVEIDSTSWKEYSVSFTVPHTAAYNSLVHFVVGTWTALGGEVEVTSPRISVENGTYSAFPKVIGACLVKLQSGVAEINPNFARIGVESVSYSSSTKQLTVQLARGTENLVNTGPIVYANLTHDAGWEYVAKAGSYNRPSANFTIEFFDMTAATVQPEDVSGISSAMYIWVHVLGL